MFLSWRIFRTQSSHQVNFFPVKIPLGMEFIAGKAKVSTNKFFLSDGLVTNNLNDQQRCGKQ